MSEHGQPITLINLFEVPAEHVGAFVAQWRERAALMAAKPGFLDSRLHRAVTPNARFRLVNVAHWESLGAWQAATSDAEFQQRVRAATSDLPITAHPAVYEMIVDVTAPTAA